VARWGVLEPTQTWLQGTFPGTGTLEFSWKASSAAKDPVSFSRLTDPPAVVPTTWRLGGVSGWVRVSADSTRRTNTVRWTYERNTVQGAGLNAAWVDDVRYTPRLPQPFSVGLVRVAQPAGAQLGFTAEAQRLFRVESTVDFREWTTLTNLANLGTMSRTLGAWIPVDPGEPQRFYQVRAE
jgi:hypothetical protein